jgi:hypothetical protein
MFLYLKIKDHFTIFFITTSFWTYYFLGGLWSDYYQTWPFYKTLIIVDIIPIFFLFIIGKLYLKPFTRNLIGNQIIIASLVVAFHTSIPLLVYDFIYFVLFLNKGESYLLDYWYLTFFSIIPWIIFPIMGYLIKRKVKGL